jgi:hypothetical protein
MVWQEENMKVLPQLVVQMLASREHRMHHYIWHQVRNNWHRYQADVKATITAKGWDPPRAAFYNRNILAMDNFSGEDFLFMHRQMIGQVSQMLSNLGDPSFPKLESWQALPLPMDTEFAVPSSWDTGDANLNGRLVRWKSDDYYFATLKSWQDFYTHPDNLRRLSLGQLGALIEFTIHNAMHMRWAAQPARVRPEPDPTNPEVIPAEWDDPKYDYLGDTYSSHVNPIFWYLHGWVEDCINRWQIANAVSQIVWTGIWVGKLPSIPAATPANFIIKMAHPEHHHGTASHLHEMTEVLKILGECKIFTEFYSDFVLP